MNVGQKWYALLPGSNKVQEIQIEEITAATILVSVLSSLMKFGIGGSEELRFPLNSIKFLEVLPPDFDSHAMSVARQNKRDLAQGLTPEKIDY